MIKINLLGEEQSADSTGLFVGIGYLTSVAACLCLCIFMFYKASAQITKLTDEQQDLETKLAQLQKTTKEVKDLETKRTELSQKLVVIATLKRSKTGPVRVLDDLNLAIPERSWILDVKEEGGSFRISGLALDNQTIASFMRSLDNSDYFDGVELLEARLNEKEGVKLVSFSISTKVSYAGKLALPSMKQQGEKGPMPVDMIKPDMQGIKPGGDV